MGTVSEDQGIELKTKLQQSYALLSVRDHWSGSGGGYSLVLKAEPSGIDLDSPISGWGREAVS